MKVHIARVQFYGEATQIIGIFSSNKRARDACSQQNQRWFKQTGNLHFSPIANSIKRAFGHKKTTYFVETVELNEWWSRGS